jgi:hypothetical protein
MKLNAKQFFHIKTLVVLLKKWIKTLIYVAFFNETSLKIA